MNARLTAAKEDDIVEYLLRLAPYSLEPAVKDALFLDAMRASFKHHLQFCPGFARYCARRGVVAGSSFATIADMPFLPVQAFKEYGDLLLSVSSEEADTRLQSSATGGIPSTVRIDKITAKRQVRALASVLAEVLGAQRRPFLMLDADPGVHGQAALGARAAAIRGFLNLASSASYLMIPTSDSKLELDEQRCTAELERICSANEPIVIFGFTYVVYAAFVSVLLAQGKRFVLPRGSKVAHIGGWKKLENQKVHKSQFNSEIAELFGIPEYEILDFYGFTEQMGVTYPDFPGDTKIAPAFSEVLVRDPVTHRLLPDGETGVLQFLTPLPYSYPGISVLTDDIGVILERGCSDERWQGTKFRVLGRAKQAEIRGCGDIMGEKIARPQQRAGQHGAGAEYVHLISDGAALYAPASLAAGTELSRLPQVSSCEALAARLREGRQKLDTYSVDELITLIHRASARWLDLDSPLFPLRQQGLLFLRNWCQAQKLRAMVDGAFHQGRGVLDGFRPIQGSNRKLIRAHHRGLAVHWLAGNVPLLGMLSLVQSILCRNANILKAASSFSSVVPLLLESFRGLEVTSSSGRVLKGDDILESIAVVYFSRDNRTAAEELSSLADIRVAWGGKEAVEAVIGLPKKYTCEDLIFGPKVSFMVIGKESLSEPHLVSRYARRAATDVSVFDQYACSSPHAIYVEHGGRVCSPREFAEALARELEKALVRIPKAPVDAGTAGRIASLRFRSEFEGTLWTSAGTEWTVLYDEQSTPVFPEPCFSRVVTVQAVDDIDDVLALAAPGIQTIGMGIQGPRKLRFAESATHRGVDRLPDIGRMTYFDSPWDGYVPLDRFVRWVTMGGPL